MRRKALVVVVSNLLMEAGFESADKQALETLIEMLQSFITEVGGSAQSYCELSGRTEVLIGDVVMSLADMGVPCWDSGGGSETLQAYARRTARRVLPPLAMGVAPKQPTILQAGSKRPHPPHIPPHLPPFPDPHAYIRTPTHKQPVTEYEAIRDRAACQKRDVERALTRFVAKTGDTHSLFLTEDNNAFPLIACKSAPNPYLNALLPKDQVFEEEEEEDRQQRRKREGNPGANAGGQQGSGRGAEGRAEGRGGGASGGENAEGGGAKGGGGGGAFGGEGSSNEGEVIDSPYLRPVKLPKKKKVK
ncbi:hypothetical protein J437_LFUL002017 [Ladona fulva]|uniref:Transcription initiation factor TFIID subunit 8 n=1 Tax=Ladona fulva TaxID=123851 RepID=A0A8K0NX69_LADFU|nr:hypothetical protein J437_LFUL002017 [Ladona fulva]